MINVLISVAVFACVKLAFLQLFTSERKRIDRVAQVDSKRRDRMGSSDGHIRASLLLLGNRPPRSGGLAWIDLSEPS